MVEKSPEQRLEDIEADMTLLKKGMELILTSLLDRNVEAIDGQFIFHNPKGTDFYSVTPYIMKKFKSPEKEKPKETTISKKIQTYFL